MMSKKKFAGLDPVQDVESMIKKLNLAFRGNLPEFQRTQTTDLPKVLPPAEDLKELKINIEWCLKLWAEHDGFIFKPGPYFNE
jgi:hypothetical protein